MFYNKLNIQVRREVTAVAEYAARGRRTFLPGLARCVGLAAALALPWALFGKTAVAVEALLAWPLAAVLQVSWGFAAALAPVAVAAMALVACPVIPAWLAVLWGGLGALGVCLRPRSIRVWIGCWAGLSLTAAGAAALALHLAYGQQQAAYGLAETVIRWIDQSPRGTELLLNAYQAGLASLEGKLAMLPALRWGAVTVMTQEVRQELLYSLRTNAEDLLTVWLPRGAVYGAGLTALACVLLPSEALRRRGVPRQGAERALLLPPMEKWRMPRLLGAAALCLCLCGLLPVPQTPALRDLQMMLSALGTLAFRAQGICLMLYLMRRAGMRKPLRGLWALLAAVFLPSLATLAGLADQFLPLRERGDDSNETEDL